MKAENARKIARILMGAGLIFAGVGPLSFARKTFQELVPDCVSLKKDDTWYYRSGTGCSFGFCT